MRKKTNKSSRPKAPKITKGVNNQKNAKRLSVKIRLGVSFAIPILCIVVMGFMSYKNVATGMEENYKKSVVSSMDLSTQYLDSQINGIEGLAMQYAMDTNLNNYFLGIGYDALSVGKFLKAKSKEIMAKALLENFIHEIYIIPESGNQILTSASTSADGFLGEMMSDPDYQPSVSGEWITQHELMDEKLQINAKNYYFSYVRLLDNHKASIVIDVNRKALIQALDEINMESGYYTGVVLPSGEQYVRKNQEENDFDFTTIDVFAQSTKEAETLDTYLDGEKYLYAYTQVGDTGIKLCTLVPYEDIMKQAYEIRNLTIIIAIIACALALLAGIRLSISMTKSLSITGQALQRVAGGDFTETVTINTKDEFEDLACDINNMVSNVSQLIASVRKVSSNVSESSVQVNTDAEEMLEGMQSIHDAISEIEEGVTGQAEDAQQCLEKMGDLSDSILSMKESVDSMTSASDGTQKMISDGIMTMNRLASESEKTDRMTGLLANHISTLGEKLQSIQQITSLITEISEQTNLLSLNASIEAASAGENGKGFTVIAQEIRKLAEQSKQSTETISQMIDEIQSETKDTVDAVVDTKNVVKVQKEIVNETIEMFDNMDQCTGEILQNIDVIHTKLQTMDSFRYGTLEAVENITAITEETAAAAVTVSINLEKGICRANELKESAVVLGGYTEHLNEQINRFTTNI